MEVLEKVAYTVIDGSLTWLEKKGKVEHMILVVEVDNTEFIKR